VSDRIALGAVLSVLVTLIVPESVVPEAMPPEKLLRSAALPWLAEAQTPLERLPADTPRLSPVVPPQTLAQMSAGGWNEHRRQIERLWTEFLGDMPLERPPLNGRVLHTEQAPAFLRRRITYEAEPGVPVEAYLLVPKEGKRPFPAMVVFHSTVDYTIRQPAGLEGPADKHIGVHLAERGYVALCPQNYIWDYGGLKWMDAVAKVKRDHPDWKGMTKMIWDGMRAVDYLCSLDYVDKKRIGCIGHSLGGKEALFLPAFDPRIKVTVSSEGGIGLSFSNWEAEWYLGPDIRKPDFPLENNQVLALIAPRPFLLLGGDSADGDKSWPYILNVKPIYDLLGASGAIAFFNHKQGHAYPPEAQKRAYEWIDHWLK
jgi:dienelactone hydrolase